MVWSIVLMPFVVVGAERLDEGFFASYCRSCFNSCSVLVRTVFGSCSVLLCWFVFGMDSVRVRSMFGPCSVRVRSLFGFCMRFVYGPYLVSNRSVFVP